MSVRKLYFLDGGEIDLPRELLLPGSGEGRLYAPISMALIETDEGNVLFDTGMNTRGLIDPSVWGARGQELRPRLTEQDDVRHRLREVGLMPEDVKYLVNSHLHWDHTGGNQFFTEATVVVQKAEYEFAFDPSGPVARGYLRNHFDHPLHYRLIEGELELMEGVSIVPTEGHTPGHQSLLVRLPEGGTVMLTADAIYASQNIAKGVVSANVWSAEASMASMLRLTALAEQEGAIIVPCHEPDLWRRVRKSPQFYTKTD